MRASQFIDYINRKEMPSEEEQKVHYTHLELDETLKKARREYRQQLKKGIA